MSRIDNLIVGLEDKLKEFNEAFQEHLKANHNTITKSLAVHGEIPEAFQNQVEFSQKVNGIVKTSIYDLEELVKQLKDKKNEGDNTKPNN